MARDSGFTCKGVELIPGAVETARESGLDVTCASMEQVRDVLPEGERYGATKPTDTDGIKTRTVEEAAGAPLTLDPSEVNVATDSGAVSGNPITVDVTHQVTLLLAPALGLPPLTIHRSATMVIF